MCMHDMYEQTDGQKNLSECYIKDHDVLRDNILLLCLTCELTSLGFSMAGAAAAALIDNTVLA